MVRTRSQVSIATTPDWRVIECNDGNALGSYGLHRATYAELLVTRWAQLTGSELSWS
jgi:hypothetical protein